MMDKKHKELDLGDSMVVMGSKNMEKSKKKGKIMLGGLNNLKKNKLAIAFNNLEMDNGAKSNDD